MSTLAEIEAAAPNFQLARYFAATGAPQFKDLNVGNPDFFKTLNAVIETTPLDDWKTYMTWRALNGAAPWLSDDFVQENFKFDQQLTGQQELPVRWKRCIQATDDNLGEALGQPYVDETFGTEGKQRMLKMVAALEKSLQRDITQLPWMTETTKKEALVKLQAIRNKIGFPDKWRDYTKLQVVRGDLLGNIMRAQGFESNRQLQKIGKPVDKLEWGMTPPTVNAYYSGSHNEIVFPAGILQPPFFDKSMDDAINMGGIGLVIGHELTHGFDDQGRKFDPKGTLRDWWTAGFRAITFDELRDAYADLYRYNADQRFFLRFARVWCENKTPELARLSVRTDPHSPGQWRVNGVVQNMPEFQKAFKCKAGQPMVKEPACHVW